MRRRPLHNISDSTSVFTSVTMRGADALGNPATGFDQVQRPTFAPGNSRPACLLRPQRDRHQQQNRNHFHIYYLYLNTGGFDPNNISCPPRSRTARRKIPTRPTPKTASSSPSRPRRAGSPTSPTGRTASVPTRTRPRSFQQRERQWPAEPVPGQRRRRPGRRVVRLRHRARLPRQRGRPDHQQDRDRQQRRTLATDNFGPAWSSVTFNQYTNAPPGFEYLAFARAFAPAGYNLNTQPPLPHDIYYLQTVRNIDAGGESARSDERGTTPEPISTPIYQVDAGGLRRRQRQRAGHQQSRVRQLPDRHRLLPDQPGPESDPGVRRHGRAGRRAARSTRPTTPARPPASTPRPAPAR